MLKRSFVPLAAAALFAAAVAFPAATFAGPGDWAFYKQIPTPDFGSGSTIGVQRLAADSTGKVYVSVNAASPYEYIYTTNDVTATTVTYTMLLQDSAMLNGFQGLVCDSANNFYVAGESGAAGTGTIRKYTSAGTLDPSFYNAGVGTPSARITGIGLLSNGVIVGTTFGGQLYTFDGVTSAAAANTGTGNYVRDIVVKPGDVNTSDVLFVNQSGDLKRITGGSATNPLGYTTVSNWGTGIVNQNTTFNVRAGVDYFPPDDTVIYANALDEKVYVVDASTGALVETLGSGTQGTAPGNFDTPSDTCTFQSGIYDYMVICGAGTVMDVYRKVNASSVQDWSLF